jgi:hypothetical protein
MITGGDKGGAWLRRSGFVLLEALFAVLLGGIFISCLISGVAVVFDESQLISLTSASMVSAQDGAAKIASCYYDKIVATDWRPEIYELFIPTAGVHFYSTNFYIITEAGMTKLIDIQNVFSYHGRLITNELYFMTFVSP